MSLVNIPLALFLLESIISPSSVLLYTPPPHFEAFLRPLSYIFFIWNLGSIMLAAIAPFTMAVYALVQLVRRRRVTSTEQPTEDVIDLSRRKFLRLALTAAAAMPFAISAYGAVAARSRRVVERVTVPVSDLPEQLDGLTIVQMSDIHSGVFMTEEQMNNYVNIANDLKPDLVALTGDFVASSNRQVEPFIRAMSKLRARLGVFGCLGNHDMFTQSERLLAAGFEAAGFKLLRNQNHLLDVEGATLNIIGLDFFQEGLGRGRSDIVLKRLPLDGTRILLLHAPYDFPLVARMGVELTLCGHTHGGQIALTIGDFIITPARLTTMFLAGLFKLGKSHLYVNRSLGTTGPPIRINAPPEITHITLKRA
jgi:predicted MPP superfamily phosphohydrolase